MKLLKLVAIALFLVVGFSEEALAADPNAKLTKVSITFTTHNDNKDHDTILNVSVVNKVSMVLSQDLAAGTNLGGDMEFKDPSTHPFDLVLKSSNVTLKDVTFPVVNIHIQPNGHDRWIFDYTVTLTFSDGSVFSSSKGGNILDQDNKDLVGVFQG